MKKETSLIGKLGILGALTASLALATPASSQNPIKRTIPLSSQAQPGLRTLPTTRAQRQRTFIYQNGEWTAAGDGIFAKSYINEVELSPEGTFPLKDSFASRNPMSFYFIDARSGLERIARNMKPRHYLTGKERAFKTYLTHLAENTPANDTASLRLLNKAITDGILSPEDSLYQNGQWKIREEVYLAMVKTRSESVPILLYFHPLNPVPPIPVVSRDSVKPTIRVDSVFITREVPTPVAPAPVIPKRARRFQLGVETEYGINNGELTAGVFGNAELFPGLRAEAFVNYAVSTEDLHLSSLSSDTTVRERELIGPGTYKNRTDIVTTTDRERGAYEFGGRILVEPWSWLDLAFGAGAKTLTGTEKVYGKSRITFERDSQPLGTPQVIADSMQNTKPSVTRLSLRAGAIFNLGKHFSLEAAYNKIGKEDRWRIGARYNFLR